MANRIFSSSTFRKILLSYTVILIIPILIFSISNLDKNIKEEKRKISDSHASDAKRISENLDNKLKELKNLGEIIGDKTWVKKSMVDSNVYDGEFDLLKDLENRKDLQDTVSKYGILSFGVLIYPEQDKIMSKWGSYGTDYFFKSITSFDTETLHLLYDSAGEYNFFKIMAPTCINLWGREINVIPVLQSLEVVNNPRATLVLFIDTTYLESYIRTIRGAEPVSLIILDNNIEVYNEFERKTSTVEKNHEKVETFTLDSQVCEWKYKLSYSKVSLEAISLNMFSSLLAIIISLIIGTIMAFLLAKTSYKPLYMLINKILYNIKSNQIKSVTDSVSEYNLIENSIDSLIKENDTLQQAIKDYESAAKSNMLIKLLNGYFKDDQQINRLKELGLNYTDEMSFCTILINFNTLNDFHIESIKKIEIITLMLVEKIMSQYSIDYQLFEVSNAYKAIILSSQRQFDDDGLTKKITSQIIEELEKNCGIRPDVLSGNVEKGLLGISKSYYLASEKLQYIIFSKDNISSNQDITYTDAYYYPTDWEIQLINNLKIGNIDTLVTILDEIKNENHNRCLSENCMIKLVSLIMETTLRVLKELNIDAGIYIKQFDSKVKVKNINELWNYIYEVGSLICQRIQFTNPPHTTQLGNKILLYVNNNYTSSDLSLKELAELFEMSVSSISKIFKEVAGINFYDYLCRLRMEMAKELLREKTCPVNSIANRVGYENVYSFKRAFERYEGIKPSEYK